MSHVTTKTILRHARENKYAVPCLLAGNMEMIIGQVKAAELCESPVIITYNHGLSHKLPMDLVVPFMVRVAERASIPVATILDHSSDLDDIRKSLVLGMRSVMFDGSNLPYEENIKQTREVADIAERFGASVEAELGSVGGSALELNTDVEEIISTYTDPDLVADFVTRTNIDQLAISVGNAHGVYVGEPKIDFALIKEIFRKTEIPLVLHGGSGLTEDDYKKIIDCGITKINYYSTMGQTAAESLQDMIEETCPNAVYHQVIDWGVDFFTEFSDYIYHLFECAGQGLRIPIIESEDSLLETVAEIAYRSFLEIEKQQKR